MKATNLYLASSKSVRLHIGGTVDGKAQAICSLPAYLNGGKEPKLSELRKIVDGRTIELSDGWAEAAEGVTGQYMDGGDVCKLEYKSETIGFKHGGVMPGRRKVGYCAKGRGGQVLGWFERPCEASRAILVAFKGETHAAECEAFHARAAAMHKAKATTEFIRRFRVSEAVAIANLSARNWCINYASDAYINARMNELEHEMRGEIPDGATWEGTDQKQEYDALRAGGWDVIEQGRAIAECAPNISAGAASPALVEAAKSLLVKPATAVDVVAAKEGHYDVRVNGGTVGTIFHTSAGYGVKPSRMPVLSTGVADLDSAVRAMAGYFGHDRIVITYVADDAVTPESIKADYMAGPMDRRALDYAVGVLTGVFAEEFPGEESAVAYLMEAEAVVLVDLATANPTPEPSTVAIMGFAIAAGVAAHVSLNDAVAQMIAATADTGGHVEVWDAITPHAVTLARLYLAIDDHPGVFVYEVAEEFGAWYRGITIAQLVTPSADMCKDEIARLCAEFYALPVEMIRNAI